MTIVCIPVKSTIPCLLNGTPVWQFNNKDILGIPRGITVDENGNLYVVGQYTSNTVVISADGQHQKQKLAQGGFA
jgi:sugar lactone lactonase YvrE